MKLYYSPGACSLSPHIALREAGLPFELVKKELHSKTLEDGSDFRAINPKGYVPVLAFDDGQLLTEGPAIVQYIADRVPDKKLAPPADTMERYRLQEWLNYITSELHKTFSPLFNKKASEDWKAAPPVRTVPVQTSRLPRCLPRRTTVSNPKSRRSDRRRRPAMTGAAAGRPAG